MKVQNAISPMDIEPQKICTNNHINSTPCTILPTFKIASNLGKRTASHVDPYATHVDISSLEGYKKQKYLKSAISATAQSYLCLSIEQKKGNKNYQAAYKEKLVKIIRYFLSTDETAAIVKYSDHVIKVKDNFVFLEDEALTKAIQLPQSLMKTQQFFHRGKPKSDGSKIYTNMRILHKVDMLDIIVNLRYELEVEDINIGLQRVQHHDVVKVGYILGMLEKIDTR